MANYSSEEIGEMSYSELQSAAKELDLKATGKTEELKQRILDEIEKDEGTNFGDIKKSIQGEIEKEDETEVFGEIERVKTGVEGLDEIMKGGIPKNNLVLISGGPGSGKTTLGLQFLVEGIKNGETGVYVNMDERKDKIIRNAKLFGWDLEKYEEEETLHFVRPRLFKFKKAKKMIDNIASRFDAERIVIDSLSVLGSAVDSETKMRRGIMELNQRFNRLDATTLSISEVRGDKISKHGVEEYAVDGIVRLYLKKSGGSFQRAIAVKKMRGTDHSKNIHPINIGKKGVKIYPDEKVFKDI